MTMNDEDLAGVRSLCNRRGRNRGLDILLLVSNFVFKFADRLLEETNRLLLALGKKLLCFASCFVCDNVVG